MRAGWIVLCCFAACEQTVAVAPRPVPADGGAGGDLPIGGGGAGAGGEATGGEGGEGGAGGEVSQLPACPAPEEVAVALTDTLDPGADVFERRFPSMVLEHRVLRENEARDPLAPTADRLLRIGVIRALEQEVHVRYAAPTGFAAPFRVNDPVQVLFRREGRMARLLLFNEEGTLLWAAEAGEGERPLSPPADQDVPFVPRLSAIKPACHTPERGVGWQVQVILPGGVGGLVERGGEVTSQEKRLRFVRWDSLSEQGSAPVRVGWVYTTYTPEENECFLGEQCPIPHYRCTSRDLGCGWGECTDPTFRPTPFVEDGVSVCECGGEITARSLARGYGPDVEACGVPPAEGDFACGAYFCPADRFACVYAVGREPACAPRLACAAADCSCYQAPCTCTQDERGAMTVRCP